MPFLECYVSAEVLAVVTKVAKHAGRPIEDIAGEVIEQAARLAQFDRRHRTRRYADMDLNKKDENGRFLEVTQEQVAARWRRFERPASHVSSSVPADPVDSMVEWLERFGRDDPARELRNMIAELMEYREGRLRLLRLFLSVVEQRARSTPPGSRLLSGIAEAVRRKQAALDKSATRRKRRIADKAAA